MITETTNVKGTVSLMLVREDGSVKYQATVPNLIVNAGKAYIAGRLLGDPAAAGYWMAIGTGSTGALANQTILSAEVARVSTSSVTQGGTNNNELTFSATFGPGTPATAQNIVEAGIFMSATANTTPMLNRATFNSVAKDTTDTLVINWTVIIN